MGAMDRTSGGFRAGLLIGWSLLCGVGIVYARWKGIPNWGAAPIIAAFLVAFPFYLVTGFPSVRERFAGRGLLFFMPPVRGGVPRADARSYQGV